MHLIVVSTSDRICLTFFEFMIAVAVPAVTAGLFIEEVLFPLSGLAPTDFINIIIISLFKGGKNAFCFQLQKIGSKLGPIMCLPTMTITKTVINWQNLGLSTYVQPTCDQLSLMQTC